MNIPACDQPDEEAVWGISGGGLNLGYAAIQRAGLGVIAASPSFRTGVEARQTSGSPNHFAIRSPWPTKLDKIKNRAQHPIL